MDIFVDTETFSELDIRDVGAAVYFEHPSTEVITIGWAMEDDPVKQWFPEHGDPSGVPQPEHAYLAFNVDFDRRALKHVGVDIPLEQWVDVAAMARAAAMPPSLDGLGEVLGLGGKHEGGSALIRRFCKPRKPSPKNPATRFPQEGPKWELFKEYNRRDVELLRACYKALPPLCAHEYETWLLDQRINETGIPIDREAALRTIHNMGYYTKQLIGEGIILTGGISPTQRDAFLEWCRAHGYPSTVLQRATIEDVLRNGVREPLKRALEIRLELSRAAPKKLYKMLDGLSADSRARGCHSYHAASTGRWGSYRIQNHNLKRSDKDPAPIVDAWSESEELAQAFYEQPLAELSEAIRGYISAPKDYVLLVGDYAAIEGRGLAWLANEEDVLEDYRQGVDRYKKMASAIFQKPIEDIDKGERFLGKTTELGCGYQMAKDKFYATCQAYGVPNVTKALAETAVTTFRTVRPKVVRLWTLMNVAAIKAVKNPEKSYAVNGKVKFFMWRRWLVMQLPSGRRLWYFNARLGKNRWDMNCVEFDGMKALDGGGRRWVEGLQTYGGKLTENAVQAICRDILVQGMQTVIHSQYKVVMHVHDEIVAEVPELYAIPKAVEQFERQMCYTPPWAKGFPVAAEAFVTKRYRKG